MKQYLSICICILLCIHIINSITLKLKMPSIEPSILQEVIKSSNTTIHFNDIYTNTNKNNNTTKNNNKPKHKTKSQILLDKQNTLHWQYNFLTRQLYYEIINLSKANTVVSKMEHMLKNYEYKMKANRRNTITNKDSILIKYELKKLFMKEALGYSTDKYLKEAEYLKLLDRKSLEDLAKKIKTKIE